MIITISFTTHIRGDWHFLSELKLESDIKKIGVWHENHCIFFIFYCKWILKGISLNAIQVLQFYSKLTTLSIIDKCLIWWALSTYPSQDSDVWNVYLQEPFTEFCFNKAQFCLYSINLIIVYWILLDGVLDVSPCTEWPGCAAKVKRQGRNQWVIWGFWQQTTYIPGSSGTVLT